MQTKGLVLEKQKSILDKVKDSKFLDSLKKNIDFITNSLDFSLQKKKMVKILGWDKEVVDSIEKEYIRFLALNKTLMEENINIKIIPNRYIDEFWHMHILDTQKYHEDSIKIFGNYFHHFPYYGMQDEKDKKDWLENAHICQSIWQICFSESLYGDLSEDIDSYEMDKEFYKKLSELYKNNSLYAMGCSRCRTCRPTNCP